ncbi:SREBP regulating gene protein [Balamuthia mandrillaris]
MKRKEGAAGGSGGNHYGQAVLYRGVGGGIAIHHEGGGGGGANALNSSCSSASPQPFHRFSRHTLSSCPGPSAFYASSLAPCDQPQRRATATKGGDDPLPSNVDTKAASLPPHWQVAEDEEEEAEEEAFREEEEWSAAKRLFVAMLAVLALLGCFLLAAVFAHGLTPLLGYSTSCANTVEGREYMADERGTLCRRSQMDWSTGCCRVKQDEQVNEGEDGAGDGVVGEGQEEYVSPCHSCNMTHHCCSIYEACVSCCMQPQHGNVLQAAKEHHQGNVWGPSTTINPSEQSVFDFCRHRCRTHSGTLHPSANRYRSPLKHCFGLSSSPSLTASSIPSPPTDFTSPSSPSSPSPLPSTQQDNIPIFAAEEAAFKVEKNEQQQLRTPSEERQEESLEDDDDEGEKEKRTKVRGGRNIHRSKRRYVDKERMKEFAEGAEQTQKNEEEEQREERERENEEQKEKPKPHQEEETQREIEKEEIDMELEEEPNEEEMVEDDEEIEEEEEEDDDKIEEQVEVKRTSIPLPLGWWTWTSQLNVTSSSSVASSAAPLHRFILPSSNSLLLFLFMVICGFLFL